MHSQRIVLTGLLAVCFVFSGCHKPTEPLPVSDIKDYDRPLPPGQFALRKVLDPADYPDFGDGWYRAKGLGLRRAVANSIAYLEKPSSQNFFPISSITHARTLASLELFRDLLEQADSPEALDAAIRRDFDVYISVGCDDAGTVLFTGYYTPIFDGSLTRTERFRFPLYRLPPDWQKDEKGDPVGGPWHTREEIERGGLLAGNEIVWLSDRFEAYVISVQGSGFIRLEDGSLYEVGYAGHNGHDYVSVGRLLIDDDRIDKRDLSLDGMIRHFKAHPEDLDKYLYQNKRYIFFQEAKGGPFGCLGQPVTRYHSVATDKDIFPRASLTFLDTRIPYGDAHTARPFRCFALDQDRGAAIRAPGRCDIYMGVGEKAGKVAGFTYSEGKLYYLFVKEGLEPVDAAEGGLAPVN
jgi:membrane-bound lytic murein transglycosylase A